MKQTWRKNSRHSFQGSFGQVIKDTGKTYDSPLNRVNSALKGTPRPSSKYLFVLIGYIYIYLLRVFGCICISESHKRVQKHYIYIHNEREPGA